MLLHLKGHFTQKSRVHPSSGLRAGLCQYSKWPPFGVLKLSLPCTPAFTSLRQTVVFRQAGNMAGAKKNRSAVYLCLWNAGAVWLAEPGAWRRWTVETKVLLGERNTNEKAHKWTLKSQLQERRKRKCLVHRVDELRRNIWRCAASFFCLSSSSGVSRELDNSVHVEMVCSD